MSMLKRHIILWVKKMKSPHVKYYQQSIYTRISAAHAINTVK